MRSRRYANLTLMMGLLCVVSFAHAQNIETNPEIQARLEKEKATIVSWASDPIIVKEVLQ